MAYHIPVMLNKCIEGLNINPNGTYVDATFGGGGHSKEIIKQLDKGKLFAFDKDTDAINNSINDSRFQLINSDFKYIKNFIKYYKANPVDGILADLGVSSFQFDSAERGFSIRYSGPLDLRMDQRENLKASDIVNTYPAAKLQDVFSKYGEVRNSRKLANTIVRQRQESKIITTEGFIKAIESCIDKRRENKYLAQVFQALRIEVNAELDSLKEFLKASKEILKPGGRLVVMSYHSLEDRIVKNFIRAGNLSGEIETDIYGRSETGIKKINSKPIIADQEEIEKNPRSRSAKLRIAEITE